MQGKKVVAAVSSLIVGVTAVFSCVPISVQAEAEKVQEVIEEVPEETQGEEGQASEDIQQKVESVPIDEEHFPDIVLRNYLVDQCDKNKDGILSEEEISKVRLISLNNSELKSLQGIEYFPDLLSLHCWGTKITEIDVSKNSNLKSLECWNTKIEDLDVSKNFNLRYLNCEKTAIKKLDISNNLLLEDLNISETQISKLDVSKNLNLKSLYFDYTEIAQIDVTHNSELTTLYCRNTKIQELDISKNLKLEHLDCNDTMIENLDISKNTLLEFIHCENTKIQELDVSKNLNLKLLWCNRNKIKKLSIDKNLNLESLECGSTLITELDTSRNGKLEHLFLSNTEISGLDVSNNSMLDSLICNTCDLTWLNVGNNSNLNVSKSNTIINLETPNKKFNIKEVLDSGIELNKVIDIKNAKLDKESGILTVIDATQPVEYRYDCGESRRGQEILKVTLNLKINPKPEELNEVPVIQAEDKTLTVGEEFDPLKDVTATDKEDGDLTGKIEILKNTVNMEEAGTYEVTYQVTDSKGASSTKTIFVTVNPKMEELNEVPVIQAEDKTLTVGEEFDPLKDVTATDKEDGDLTGKIEILKNTVNMEEAGTYEVTYQVTDSKGASSTKTIFVTVNPKMEELNEVPVIQAEDKTLTVGEEFDPLKDVTATDKEDGDLTGKIEILKNTVNMEEAGTYEVTYQVTDSKGASSTKTIFVTVNPKMEELNEVPVIQAEDKTLTVGEEFDPLKDVTATDKEDGDLTGKIEILKNTVNMEEAGTYEVTYQVTDSKGASSTKTIFVTVNPKMEEPTVPEVPDKPNKPNDVTKPDKKPEMDSIVPETADVSNIGGMASMLMGSVGLLVVLFGNRRKK